MLPNSPELCNKIHEAARNGFAVAELECLGLSVRTINALEASKYNIIFLDELIERTDKELSSLRNLGKHGLREITAALAKFARFEEANRSLQKGSDRLEFYKQRIPRQSETLR